MWGSRGWRFKCGQRVCGGFKEGKADPSRDTEDWGVFGVYMFYLFLVANFQIILYLQKSCRDSTEVPYTLPPASPSASISHNDGAVVKSRKLTVTIPVTTFQTSFRFYQFSTNAPALFKVHSRTQTVLDVSPAPPSVWDIPSVCPWVLWPWPSWWALVDYFVKRSSIRGCLAASHDQGKAVHW